MARNTSFYNIVKEKVPLQDYLQNHLNVEIFPAGAGTEKAICPFHEEDSPSFVITQSDGGWYRWRCFGSCNEGGSVIDAVKKAENFDRSNDAVEYLNSMYGLGLDMNNEHYKEFRKTVKQTAEAIEKGEAEMANQDSQISKIARDYLHNRGFNDDTISHFRLNIDLSKNKSGRLAIPLIDKANNPVSMANRALFDFTRCKTCKEKVTPKEMQKRAFSAQKAKKNGLPPVEWQSCPHCNASEKEAGVAWIIGQNPKYLFIGDFDKSHFLYNENEASQALRKDKDALGLFLVEGYADCWAGWQAESPTICAYNGAQLSEWQAEEAVEMAIRAEKPIILIPDFDETGAAAIVKNIELLRAQQDDIEIQVVYGVDKLLYNDDGVKKPCKDLGDVLKYFGPDKVKEVLLKNRYPAAEHQVRLVLAARNEKTGQPFHSLEQQQKLVGEILSNVTSKSAIDHLIPWLAEQWEKPDDVIRQWFNSKHTSDDISYEHLLKSAEQMRAEAHVYINEGGSLPTGFAEIDRCLPGGGVKRGQLMMFLGKAQPMDSMILTASGWKTMGEMTVGTELIDPLGTTAKIKEITPQGERDIYRITFSDASQVECDLLHLWQIKKDNEVSVLTLEEFINDFEDLMLPSFRNNDFAYDLEIVSIEFSRTAEAQCIALDSQSKLYITDNGIVTHNSGTGKALASEEPVLTPTGWVPIGELKVGDTVVDPTNGKPTLITGVFPQGKRQLYKATFSDGTSVECDGDHLWQVEQPGRKPVVRDTLEIKKRIEKGDYHSSHRIPLTAPVEFEEKGDLPIHPYVLGALLGDGTITEGRSLRLCSMDPELAERFNQFLPEGCFLELSKAPTEKNRGAYYVRCKEGYNKNTLWPLIEQLGLRGTYSHTKYIPEVYKTAPLWARIELLRGLMDTDGSIASQVYKVTNYASTNIEYSSTSLELSEGVADLVRSLGGLATINTGKASYKDKNSINIPCKDRHRVHIAMTEAINPFWLPRKADKFSRSSIPRKRFISIEPTRIADATCIKVASEAELFITKDYIVTHNTMLSTQMLANMGSNNIRAVFFSLEQAAKSLYARLVSQALDVNQVTAEEYIRVNDPILDQVDEIFKNIYIFDNVPQGDQKAISMTPDRVRAVVQNANLTKFKDRPADVVIIDHLGILAVPDDAPRDVAASDLAAPGYIMQELFHVCKEVDVAMMVLQQLPKEVPPGAPFNYDAGRGGSKQTDSCDYIFCIWRPEQDATLSDIEKAEVEGQYKLALGKNRYGASTVANLMFDKSSLRIMPPLEIVQPHVEVEEDETEVIRSEIMTAEKPVPVEKIASSDAGATPEGMQALVREHPDNTPQDNMDLLNMIGASEEADGAEDADQMGDPELLKWFEN